MFCPHRPIETMRIFSLRDEWQLWEIALGDWASMQRKPRCASRFRVTPPRDPTSEDPFVPQLNVGSHAAGLADSARARQERLAGIREAIAEGRYRVSSEDLAQALINHLIKE